MANPKETTQPSRVKDVARKYRERALMNLGLLTGFVWTAEIGHLINEELVIDLSLGAGLVAYLAILSSRLKYKYEQHIEVESIVSDVVMKMRQHHSIEKAPVIRDGLDLIAERARYYRVNPTAVMIQLSHLNDPGRTEETKNLRALRVANRVNSDIFEKYHDPHTMVQFARDVRTALAQKPASYANGFVKALQHRKICVEAWGTHAFDSELAASKYSNEEFDESKNRVRYWEDRHKLS